MNYDEEDLRRFITTSKLAAYLGEFRLSFTNISDEEKLENEVINWDALSEATTVTYRLNRKIYLSDPNPNLDILQKTLLCRTLLSLALERLIAKIIISVDWKVLEGPSFQPWLQKRMTEAGWCPFDIRFLSLNFDPDIMAFILSLVDVQARQRTIVSVMKGSQRLATAVYLIRLAWKICRGT